MRGIALDFRFAEFEIDIARQELRRDGAIIHIEPQVFGLLIHLVRNRDRVVSKDELIDVIWQGRIVSDATLTSRISAARRALGDSGNDQSLIRTLHKRGFRFVAEVESNKSAPSAIEPLPLSDAWGAIRPLRTTGCQPDQDTPWENPNPAIESRMAPDDRASDAAALNQFCMPTAHPALHPELTGRRCAGGDLHEICRSPSRPSGLLYWSSAPRGDCCHRP
jgi:DNA-binding winged helix-turn-helix (wHTH) protein